MRGKRPLRGVEIVTDAHQGRHARPAVKQIVERCKERGVIVGQPGGAATGQSIILAPPLVLTRPEIDRIVTVLDQTIPEVCGAAA